MPPPLPPSILDLILSHLLPPSAPLPPQLLSRSLLDRHTFLPPSPNDIDAHLSPFPSNPSQPISSRLLELTEGYEVDEAGYIHDGEVFLSRVPIRPTHSPYPKGDGEGVDLIFEFEEGERGRGWLYRSARLPEHDPTELEWVKSMDPVKPKKGRDARAEEDEQAPEDYWAGFSPPRKTMDLSEETKDGGEDDYWKQYGEGGMGETPGIGTSGTPGITDIASKKNASTAQDLKTRERRSASDSVLHDKVVSKINVLLRQAWSEFTRDADGRQDVLEEKALLWLKVGQEVIDRRNGEEIVGMKVMRAKLEVLAEMYGLVEDGDGEGFWRSMEGAIRMPIKAKTPGDSGQLGYWE